MCQGKPPIHLGSPRSLASCGSSYWRPIRCRWTGHSPWRKSLPSNQPKCTAVLVSCSPQRGRRLPAAESQVSNYEYALNRQAFPCLRTQYTPTSVFGDQTLDILTPIAGLAQMPKISNNIKSPFPRETGCALVKSKFDQAGHLPATYSLRLGGTKSDGPVGH